VSGSQEQVNNRKIKGRFQKGLSGNPGGRPKGIKDKAVQIKLGFYEAFDKLGGVDGLVAWAKKYHNLKEFYKILAHMLPREVDVQGEGIGNTRVLIIHPTEKEMNEYKRSRGITVKTVSKQVSE